MLPVVDRKVRFAHEYLIDLNCTQAAIRAGYSRRGAHTQGSRLLKDAEVQRVIQELLERRKKRNYVSQDRVVRELARIAFSDMADFVAWDEGGVTPLDSMKLGRAKSRAIKEISEKRGEHGSSVNIKLHDKLKALELLGRHLGIFKQDEPRDVDDHDLPDAENSANYTERILREVMQLPQPVIDVGEPEGEDEGN